MDKRKYSKVVSSLIFLMLFALSISFLSPFFYMFLNSIKTDREYYINPFALPLKFDLSNYFSLVTQFKILGYLYNSLVISVSTVLLVIVLSVIPSYIFAKVKFKGSDLIYIFIIMTMFVPGQVTIIPLYVMYSKIGLISTPLSVILANVSAGVPAVIMLMTSYFRGLPNEVIEAAKIDGCSFIRLTIHVIIPMGKPVIALNVIFTFLSTWNDIFTPLILLTRTESQTIMVAIDGLVSRYDGSPSYQMAGLMIACIPVIIVYLVCQKYLIKGMNAGAIK